MDWNRLSPFVATPLRACLAILAVNAALILVSEPIFQALAVVMSGAESLRAGLLLFGLHATLFLLFVALSAWVWYRFGRLLRGRFTVLQRLAPAVLGVLPILGVAAWLVVARGDQASCGGILAPYLNGMGAAAVAFATVMVASSGRRPPGLSA